MKEPHFLITTITPGSLILELVEQTRWFVVFIAAPLTVRELFGNASSGDTK